MKVLIGLLLAGLLFAACEPEPPTPTPVPTVKGAVRPSPTVDAALPKPTPLPGGNLEALDFTPGAPPTVSGSNSATITPSPLPTQASIPIHVPSSDLILFGTYYPASHSPAPGVLLLHGIGETRTSWGSLPGQLQAAGYAVLTVDLRGFGETGGTVDWNAARNDPGNALGILRGLRGVDPAHVSLIGSGIGADLAIVGCAADASCKGVIAISPRAVDQGIAAGAAIRLLGKRPLLIFVSADDDPSALDSNTFANTTLGDHRIQRFDGKLSGLALLAAHPEIGGQMIDWLSAGHN